MQGAGSNLKVKAKEKAKAKVKANRQMRNAKRETSNIQLASCNNKKSKLSIQFTC
jgi:hypothetical protein